ncbi:hypothetical protein C8J57DRAFT_1602059 [Mycena rebaudengoi]|nr:hypothetical protein C8J57DRAFT_1602059 [Mycena rebaudengoi]
MPVPADKRISPLASLGDAEADLLAATYSASEWSIRRSWSAPHGTPSHGALRGKIGHSEGLIWPEMASDCRGFCRAAGSDLIGLATDLPSPSEWRGCPATSQRFALEAYYPVKHPVIVPYAPGDKYATRSHAKPSLKCKHALEGYRRLHARIARRQRHISCIDGGPAATPLSGYIYRSYYAFQRVYKQEQPDVPHLASARQQPHRLQLLLVDAHALSTRARTKAPTLLRSSHAIHASRRPRARIEKGQKSAVPASKPRKIDAVAPTSSGSPLSSLSDVTIVILLNLALLALPPYPLHHAHITISKHGRFIAWLLRLVHSGNDRLTRNDRITPEHRASHGIVRCQLTGIPQEIIDALVDEIAEDTRTLVACSLAGPIFTTPTRRQLFRRMDLYCWHAGRVLELITSCPRVLPFVRTLFIDFAGAEGEHEQMIRIMHKLRNIEVLTLEYYNTSDLSPTFLASAMTASPALTLGDSRVVGQYVSPPPSSRPSALECLILLRRGMGTDQQRFLLHPTTSIHFRSLKRLHLHEAAGAEFCAALLSLTSPSLERLKLQCSPNALLPLFDFPRLPALRFVEFQISRVVVSRIDIIVAHMRDVAPQVEILVTHY